VILVLAGTSEGRMTATRLGAAGIPAVATAVTEYGADLLRDAGVEDVLVGPLERERLSSLLTGNNIRALVDATHPYAVNITEMALELCKEKGVHYIRLERPASQIPDHPLVAKAYGLDDAVDKALSVGGVLFSTIGSRNLLRIVNKAQKRETKLIARVLPDPKVLTECSRMGLRPNQIIAAQGPFSKRLNMEFFRFYGAGAVITKESGDSGGVDTKVAAALELGIHVVIWMRPCFDYPLLVSSPEEAVEKVVQKFLNY